MRYGLIDIGSNTIRGVVYRIKDGKAEKIEDKLVKSHILGETIDSKLTESGLERLIAVLNKLTEVLKSAGSKRIDCIATSSLRGIKNIEEVKNYVCEITGVDINVLSGEEEARYDFEALRANVPERNAIGLDLGGGSCQILQFENNRILFSRSYDIGSNRLKNKCVSGTLPTIEERNRINFCVRNELAGISNMFGSRYLYVMGGTAKAALRLYNRLTNTVLEDKFLSVEKLDMLSKTADNDPERMYKLFTQILKSRADTVIPGIEVLKTVCYLFDVEGIYVLSCSVRDGYVAEVIRKGEL